MNCETLPIPRTTLTAMALAYATAEKDIRSAYALLTATQENLTKAFHAESYGFNLSVDRPDYSNADSLVKQLKHSAWRALINKMGVRSAMSIKRAEELDAQLEGKARYGCDPVQPLPEITEANILTMIEQTFNNIPQMIEESVREVFDWLRPHSSNRLEYKTNQKSQWELKEKLILGYCVEGSYSTDRPFRVSYHRQKNLTALDNVFSMLDGKGIIKTNHGPLTDAILACSREGTGATAYFQFKCYGNRNLHLKFLRADLVSKLNAVAGGMRLGNGQND